MAGKQKTNQSMAKRFKTTKTKILRQKAAHNHRLVPKSKKAKGKAKYLHAITKGDAKNIRKKVFK